MHFLEVRYIIIAIGNTYLQFKKKLNTQECVDLAQLASKATQIEQFLIEKE